MTIALIISLFLGIILGHCMVMLVIIEKGRREDIQRYGYDLAPMPRVRLAYWIATPLSLAGIVACSVVSSL